MFSQCLTLSISAVALAFAFSSTANSQVANAVGRGRPLITQSVNENQTVSLKGNVRSAANAANDLGRVSDVFEMEHMLLQLKRSPEQEQALAQFLAQVQNPASPNYRKWLTATQFGQQFGLAQQDLDSITGWLQAQGFTVNQVYSNHMVIDFSGTAAQVRRAFRTEIHRYNVAGKEHVANMSDPQIPAALAPAIAGVVSLHDFTPHALNRPRPDYTFTSGSNTYQAVAPADLATIYDLNRLFAAGTSGQYQAIAVIEDSDVYNPADWTTFRNVMGLSGYTLGSFTQVHPGNCADPGVANGDDGEATLDAEWASAAAPSAAIVLASCRDTRTTFGGLIALQNLINADSVPQVISISYGECEAENGAAGNATYSYTYQQAAAEGISIFVSSGDEGAASCDAGSSSATHGIGVSGFASTPYNVAVGGTDFGDTFAGTNSTYWAATNTNTFGSAQSYVPEIPWNDSCAGVLLSTFAGFSTPYGNDGFCNSSLGERYYLTLASGSGGPSGCATGIPSIPGVVSGSCAGNAKPDWQAGLLGNPNDGVRDIPDVSLFAGNGVWGHYYVFCWSNIRGGGASCAGPPNTWAGAGGTSFGAPIMAGIQALVDQYNGGAQGNPNVVYYQFAKFQYSSSSGIEGGCNSTAGNAVDVRCIFYDVTQGDMDVNCTGTQSCFDSTSTVIGRQRIGGVTNGVLSLSSGSYEPAFGTNSGWDFATGIGSVNAANLVYNWVNIRP